MDPRVVLVVGAGLGDAISDLGGQAGVGRRQTVVEPNPLSPGVAGLDPAVVLIREPSFLALPRLIADGLRVDLAFIDGRHLFDHLLVDLFYCDRLLRLGGVAAVNNASWPGLAKAVAYFETNRAYRRLDGPERLALLQKEADDDRAGNRRDDAGLLFNRF
ncbi:MAG: hypothetical protein NVS9B1_04350 [Candidatus Dormibacteraceae bacterium]